MVGRVPGAGPGRGCVGGWGPFTGRCRAVAAFCGLGGTAPRQGQDNSQALPSKPHVPERFPRPGGREAAPFLLLTRGGAAHDDRLHLDLGDSQQQRAVPLSGDGRHDGSSCTLDQAAVQQVAACRAEGLRQRTELRGSAPASGGLGPPPPVGQRAWPRVQPQGTLSFPSRPAALDQRQGGMRVAVVPRAGPSLEQSEGLGNLRPQGFLEGGSSKGGGSPHAGQFTGRWVRLGLHFPGLDPLHLGLGRLSLRIGSQPQPATPRVQRVPQTQHWPPMPGLPRALPAPCGPAAPTPAPSQHPEKLPCPYPPCLSPHAPSHSLPRPHGARLHWVATWAPEQGPKDTHSAEGPGRWPGPDHTSQGGLIPRAPLLP